MLQDTLLISEDTLVGGLGGSKTLFTSVEVTPFCAKPKEVEIFNLVVVALRPYQEAAFVIGILCKHGIDIDMYQKNIV